MSYCKTYAGYYPYATTNGGRGKEYNFQIEESYIDYDKYFSCSLNTYLDLLEERYSAYCSINNINSLKINNTEENSLLNNCKIFNQKAFESFLITKYLEQKAQADTNPQYGFICLNDDFISNFLNSINNSLNISTNRTILKYLFNKNQYLQEIIQNDNPLTSIINIQTYAETDSNYIDRDFYIGVGDHADVNNQNITYEFRYTEYKTKIKKFQCLVNKLQIFAPLGTVFYLNRALHPIYITQELQLGSDEKIGFYELNTENYANIYYLTFPKEAIPKDCEWNDSTHTFNINGNPNKSIIVTYYYDDVMELQEE